MKSIANKMKIHKKVTKTEVEERTSLGRDGLPEYGSTLTVVSNDILLNMDLSPNYSESFQQIDSVPFSITTPVCVDKLQDREQTPFSLKAQDFQVCQMSQKRTQTYLFIIEKNFVRLKVSQMLDRNVVKESTYF
jgi:hypothetical protein